MRLEFIISFFRDVSFRNLVEIPYYSLLISKQRRVMIEIVFLYTLFRLRAKIEKRLKSVVVAIKTFMEFPVP